MDDERYGPDFPPRPELDDDPEQQKWGPEARGDTLDSFMYLSNERALRNFLADFEVQELRAREGVARYRRSAERVRAELVRRGLDVASTAKRQ